MNQIRILWIRDPWISMIEAGEKLVEFRNKSTSYRGPVILAASKRAESDAPDDMAIGPLGVTRCLTEIVDCEPISDDLLRRAYPGEDSTTPEVRRFLRERKGSFGWVLSGKVTVLPRIPTKGRLGLVRPNDAELTAVNGFIQSWLTYRDFLLKTHTDRKRESDNDD